MTSLKTKFHMKLMDMSNADAFHAMAGINREIINSCKGKKSMSKEEEKKVKMTNTFPS